MMQEPNPSRRRNNLLERRSVLHKREIILKPVWPNAGVRAWYARQLRRLTAEMNASVVYWLEASYKANEPIMAQDELPAEALWKAMRKLRKRWQKNFDEAGPKLAKLFAERTNHETR